MAPSRRPPRRRAPRAVTVFTGGCVGDRKPNRNAHVKSLRLNGASWEPSPPPHHFPGTAVPRRHFDDGPSAPAAAV
eukprot:3422045-Prymnesium_polylepis.1